MKNAATQSMTLASPDKLDELFSEEIDNEGSSCSRSAPIDADLLSGYLDALRRGVVLGG